MKCIFYLSLFSLLTIRAQCQENNLRIDSLLQTYYTAYQPGAAVAICRHNKIIFKKEYGVVNTNTGKK